MGPAEVFAVAVERLVSQGCGHCSKTCWPDGRDQITKPVSTPTERLSVEDSLAQLAAAHGSQASDSAMRIAGWFFGQGYEVGVTGSNDKLCVRISRITGGSLGLFVVGSNGRLET